jgi:hypothetical protein
MTTLVYIGGLLMPSTNSPYLTAYVDIVANEQDRGVMAKDMLRHRC